MERGLVKITELAEVAKLTPLLKKKRISTFITDWKPLIEFSVEQGGKVIYDL